MISAALEIPNETEEHTRCVDALRCAPIFAQLPEATLKRIAQTMSSVEVPAGALLIEARAKGTGMFVIEEGSVLVYPRGSQPIELGPGEVVGELALLLPDESRTARVQAKTFVRCFALDRQSFRQLMEAEPQLAIALLESAVRRLAELRPTP
jgi:CPA1 family monovalent cation:H+ antiporter